MRAKFIFEKFTEDSDPIHDMGIGIERIISNAVEDKWPFVNYPKPIDVYKYKDEILYVISGIDIDNENRLINMVSYLLSKNADFTDKGHHRIISKANEKIKQLIKDKAKEVYPSKGFNNSEEQLRFIKEYDINENKEIIQDLVNKMITFPQLPKKILYAKIFNVDANLTPAQKLKTALDNHNFDLFKEALKGGAKLKSLNPLYSSTDRYFPETPNGKQDILDYLTMLDKKKKLEKYVDSKNIDKIQQNLKIKTTKSYKEYPRGYKIYRLLKYVKDNNVPAVKLNLTKFLFELTYGPDSFNPALHSSHWADGFEPVVYPRVQEDNGIWRLTTKGKEDLVKFEKRFKDQKIDAYI